MQKKRLRASPMSMSDFYKFQSKTFYLFHNLDSANKKSFEPDKNFIESLKDAMRTVVNYKERGAQRAKAPDFLALYSDQLLKGKV